MKKIIIPISLLLLYSDSSFSIGSVHDVKPSIAETELKSSIHDEWNIILQKYVSVRGDVDYKGILENAGKLNSYLLTLKEEYVNINSHSQKYQLAYWINVYNAFTIKLIIDNYPVTSIIKINSGKPWDKKFIQLGSDFFSLNQIENEIIRKRFNEPRVHFALNCASESCPKLLNRAFTESNLEEMLDFQTKYFINNKTKNTISKNEISISKIFDWYKEDFEKGQTLIDFLNKYSYIKINSEAKVSYMEYSWELNKK